MAYTTVQDRTIEDTLEHLTQLLPYPSLDDVLDKADMDLFQFLCRPIMDYLV